MPKVTGYCRICNKWTGNINGHLRRERWNGHRKALKRLLWPETTP